MTDAPQPAEPSAASLLQAAQAELEGWGFFQHASDPKKPDEKQQAKSQHELRMQAIAATLYVSVPEFAELVEFLLDKTLRRATFVAQLGLDPMQAYSFGVFREGQNAVVCALLKMIAEGRRLQPPKGRDL